jgi:2-octaprenyl-6-methoxyphenol hydroxylase
MTKKSKIYDVAIIGGGLAGLSLAALLGQSGFNILCIDREDKAKTLTQNFDGRTTAISYGSAKILTEAGVWDSCEKNSCPILDIRILDGASSVLLNFLSHDVEDRAFGHIIENRLLRQAQYKKIATLKNVIHLDNIIVTDVKMNDDYAHITTNEGHEYKAQLVVGADGKQSFIRKIIDVPHHEWGYNQTAIVCCVDHEKPHHNVAIEHFLPDGPFAVLPMNDNPATGKHQSSLVWTVHGSDKRMIDCDDDIFNIALNARFPKEYGAVKLFGKRSFWPLGLSHAHSFIDNRIVIIAEAAHAMHPIAGQGLNIGMRDIKTLHDLLIDARAQNKDLGSQELLNTYQSMRRIDTSAMMAATDILNRLFSNKSKVLGLARKIGIKAVNHMPPVKRFFMHQAMGLGFNIKRYKL